MTQFKEVRTTVNTYLELCKFKVVLLMMLSAATGMIMTDKAELLTGIISLLGISLLSCSGGALNQLLDQKIDSQMSRTKNRPLPKGSISSMHAMLFILAMIISGIICLIYTTNILTISLTLFAMFGYSFIYTLGLKHLTPQNIVIGGITGAMPPLLGWCAVTNSISYQPLLLVLLIYTWTPPHFWALAIAKKDDYAKSQIPMLPVTHGIKFTKRCILAYIFITAALAILPFALNISGLVYFTVAVLLNIRYIYLGILLYKDPSNKCAMQNFLFSISYLMVLFAGILIDKVIQW